MSAEDTGDVRAISNRALVAGLASIPPGVEVVFVAGDPVYPRVLVMVDSSAATSVRDAAPAALTAVGYAAHDLSFMVLPADADPDSLRLPKEILDPEVVVTLSGVAHGFVLTALGATEQGGHEITEIGGRRIVEVGEFASALDDERAKRAAWERFKLRAREALRTDIAPCSCHRRSPMKEKRSPKAPFHLL